MSQCQVIQGHSVISGQQRLQVETLDPHLHEFCFVPGPVGCKKEVGQGG